MSLIFIAFEVLKLERFRESRDEQSANMRCIFVTFEVSKLERSKEVNDRQPKNMLNISFTLEVSKLVRLTEARDWQRENIPKAPELISVTCAVLKLDKSSVMSELHP